MKIPSILVYFKYIFFLTLIINTQSLFGQEVVLSGVISDSANIVLPNANIIALPKLEVDKVRFAITNQKGEYRLALVKDVEYTIEISYLGYNGYKFSFVSEKDVSRNILLKQSSTELDEVILSYEIPIIVKKDTIVYDPKAFINGRERKLKEVLKKLPGVDVDREGNVTVKGEKINKILVDGEIFFTGDTKLAVNNLPANVIEKIEVYENYNEIAFLKDLQDLNDKALNIKLKKDKKNFSFGDVDTGLGLEKRYSGHSNLFYYAPKTNINFIGDLNNVGVKSFTLKDFVNFEGGFGNQSNSINNSFGNGLGSFFVNNDFISNRNQFGAFSLKQNITSKTKLNSYIIANNSRTRTLLENDNEFINNSFSTNENRRTRNLIKNFFIIGKATINYKSNSKEDLKTNSFFKISDNSQEGFINTITQNRNNVFSTINDFSSIEIKQNIAFNKKISKKHTITAEGVINYQENDPNKELTSNEQFLLTQLPLQADSVFNAFQNNNLERTNIDVFLKDYWVLNTFNHLYTSIGTNLTYESYITNDGQVLTDGSLLNFDDQFGNDISYELFDTFVGIEYKFLVGVFTFKPGLFFHTYQWENSQVDTTISQNVNLVLPELDIKVDISNIENLRFKYKRDVRFPNSPSLSRNSTLVSFNSLFFGDPNLQNDRSHNFSLNYSKFNFIKGLSVRSFTNYTIHSKSIKNNTILVGIDQNNTLSNLNRQENSISSILDISKRITNYKFAFRANARYDDFFTIVNTNTTKNLSRSLSLKGTIGTNYDTYPNIKVSYRYSPSNFRTSNSNTNFRTNEISANFDYTFLKDFILKADYTRVDFNNRASNNTSIYNIANASLFYQKEDSPWGFEIVSTNLFNVEFKRQSSFTEFVISDQRTFILPRILLFKVSYKL